MDVSAYYAQALRERGFVSGSREDAARSEAKAKRASCAASQADVAQAAARLAATRVDQARTHHHIALPFHQIRPDDDICDTRFVFQRDEAYALGAAGPNRTSSIAGVCDPWA